MFAMPPEADDVDAFARVLEQLVGPGTRFAFLRSRPRGGRPDPAAGPGQRRT